MKQSDGLFPFKRISLYKKKKPESSSSSSSSSLGAAANNIVVEPDVPRPQAGGNARNSIKDTLLTMGHAMENALVGNETKERIKKKQEPKKKHGHHHKTKEKNKDDKKEKKTKGSDDDEEPLAVELQPPPLNELDFLQRRKLAAAQMRIKNEMEMEKEHPLRHPMLDLHYLPPVLRDATSLNLSRFQVCSCIVCQILINTSKMVRSPLENHNK